MTLACSAVQTGVASGRQGAGASLDNHATALQKHVLEGVARPVIRFDMLLFEVANRGGDSLRVADFTAGTFAFCSLGGVCAIQTG